MTARVRPSRLAFPAIAGLAVMLGACASSEPPSAQLGAAQTAITEAERSGAAQRAPVELNDAREKLARAQEATRRGRHEVAARLASEAEVDAQLASAKSQSEAADTALEEVRKSITALRGEIDRRGGR